MERNLPWVVLNLWLTNFFLLQIPQYHVFPIFSMKLRKMQNWDTKITSNYHTSKPMRLQHCEGHWLHKLIKSSKLHHIGFEIMIEEMRRKLWEINVRSSDRKKLKSCTLWVSHQRNHNFHKYLRMLEEVGASSNVLCWIL